MESDCSLTRSKPPVLLITKSYNSAAGENQPLSVKSGDKVASKVLGN